MKRLTAFLLAALTALACCACGYTPKQTTPAASVEPTTTITVPTPKNTMTGEELMKDMKIGWNLGNTFDAPDGEISWGMPFTTPEILQKVKEMGFHTIRIPISWHKHVSAAPEYTIDETWMDRVDTVVNQALDLGMYVIINSHHDNNIYVPTPDNQEAASVYLTAIWSQIAEHFKDADYHLIFQCMNEPRVEGTAYEWNIIPSNPDCMAAVEVVNVLNQTVVDTIRATGGRNADRWIIVSPYVANAGAAALSSFRLPTDPANKLIVSMHSYAPYNLCLNVHSDVTDFTRGDYSDISTPIKSLHNKFVSKGIPVIIDEMGCRNKENDEARYEWAKYYVSTAAKYGMVCIWWDNGVVTTSSEGFGILNRRKLEVYEQSKRVLQGLMDGLTQEDADA